MSSALRQLGEDPRHFQIAMLGGLLAYGQGALGFGLEAGWIAAIGGAALAVQWALGRAVDGVGFEPRSALISALSLCLLLRADAWLWGPLAAAIAVGSKFALRRRGRHVANPTALALAALALCSDAVWISPGQWGSAALGAFAVAGLGSLVVRRAARSDVTWAFLACYAGGVLGRALWLGDAPAIALHQLQSGALLLFAFFMISDPRTTPDARAGRVLWAACVAACALWLRFAHFEPNALVYALVACTPLVPCIDRLLPAPRHCWPGEPEPRTRGDSDHATPHPHALRPGRPRPVLGAAG